MMIRGALLDIDGTLLDSNDAHAAAFVDALAAEGFDIPLARVRPLIGMGTDKLFPVIGLEPGSRAAKLVARAKDDIFAERYLPKLRPFHGARDLLLAMRKRGLTLTVATSAGEKELHSLLRAAHIDDLIDAHSTSSDANASKPDPEILEAAIVRAGVPRDQLFMLGDSPYDVEAARRASVPVIALRAGGWSDDELTGAAEIYDDPAALLREYEGSLLGRCATPQG